MSQKMCPRLSVGCRRHTNTCYCCPTPHTMHIHSAKPYSPPPLSLPHSHLSVFLLLMCTPTQQNTQEAMRIHRAEEQGRQAYKVGGQVAASERVSAAADGC